MRNASPVPGIKVPAHFMPSGPKVVSAPAAAMQVARPISSSLSRRSVVDSQAEGVKSPHPSVSMSRKLTSTGRATREKAMQIGKRDLFDDHESSDDMGQDEMEVGGVHDDDFDGHGF